MAYPIRAGTEQDWRALRILLPEAFHHGSGSRSIVATSEDGRLILGAAAISPRFRSEPFPGPRVAVHVIPPYRRQGIARQLLAACAAAAARVRAGALYAWKPVLPNSEGAHTWRGLGFRDAVTVYEGQAQVSRLYDRLKPMYEEVVNRQWIPREAKIVPLSPVYAEQITRLHVAYLGGEFAQILNCLRGDSGVRYHPQLSPVLLLDSQVMAFTLLATRAPGTAYVDSTVVHPALRGGWANLWLKFAGACACRDLGIHTLQFLAYARHSDTRKIARQIGGTIVELTEPYRKLETPKSAAAPPPGALGDHTPRPQ